MRKHGYDQKYRLNHKIHRLFKQGNLTPSRYKELLFNEKCICKGAYTVSPVIWFNRLYRTHCEK